ncbi:MAG: TonB-dependent receptor [Desulfobacterales bacterium]
MCAFPSAVSVRVRFKGGADLEGNEVPGIPKHQVFTEMVYSRPSGFYAGLDARFVSRFFADDENTVETHDYIVTDFRTGLRRRFGKWRISPSFGIRNLFDESYSNNVRINARGNRFFEPAPGFNIYAGPSLGYSW